MDCPNKERMEVVHKILRYLNVPGRIWSFVSLILCFLQFLSGR